MTSKKIRTRIPPSPTGMAHIGTAQAALINWLFAKKNGGDFIMRVEDTDKQRSEKKFEDDVVESVKWLGLDWDEFYRQSERTEIYSKYIKQLLDEKKIFWCYHTADEMEAEKSSQYEKKEPPRHLCNHKNEEPNSKDEDHRVLRIKVDWEGDRKIKFTDLVRGEIETEARLLGDFSIAKELDEPLYNFAVVVDDYEMTISHVIRGEDHISNTPKQILIQEALGFASPEYAHYPLLLGSDRSKLGKRHGATGISEYRSLGFLASSLVNYLALIGFTPFGDEKEIFSIEELKEAFDIGSIHKSGAVFDIKKLEWINSEYIKQLSDANLVSLVGDEIRTAHPHVSDDDILKVLPLMRERMKKLTDVSDFSYFFKDPDYEPSLLVWKDRSQTEIKRALTGVQEIVTSVGLGDTEKLRGELDAFGAKLNDRGLVYWPFRVSLTGVKRSPDPVDIAVTLGDEESLKRIGEAIDKL